MRSPIVHWTPSLQERKERLAVCGSKTKCVAIQIKNVTCRKCLHTRRRKQAGESGRHSDETTPGESAPASPVALCPKCETGHNLLRPCPEWAIDAAYQRMLERDVSALEASNRTLREALAAVVRSADSDYAAFPSEDDSSDRIVRVAVIESARAALEAPHA